MKTLGLIAVLALFCCIYVHAQSTSGNHHLRQLHTSHSRRYAPLVSLSALIANPKQYDGKRVTVKGFLYITFETSAIYIDRKDCEQHNYAHSLYIGSMQTTLIDTYSKLPCRYVMLEGIINAKDTGHLAMFHGSINLIPRVVLLKENHVVTR